MQTLKLLNCQQMSEGLSTASLPPNLLLSVTQNVEINH